MNSEDYFLPSSALQYGIAQECICYFFDHLLVCVCVMSTLPASQDSNSFGESCPRQSNTGFRGTFMFTAISMVSGSTVISSGWVWWYGLY